jgi:predicted phosphodiesterase
MSNKSVLLISDQHAPYHHKDTLDFLKAIRDEIQPDRVINLGDEADFHDISFHKSEKSLYSAGDELKHAKDFIKDLEKLFPEMDLLESNHGSLTFRKALDSGLPYEVMKPYQMIWGVRDKWKWHFDLTIKLPNGNSCYFTHGKSADVLKLSQSMGICAVQGHYHNRFKIEYWQNPLSVLWGMQIGCLIDDTSRAFAYNKNQKHKPMIGTGVIVDGHPALVPMVLNKKGRWVKRLYFI